MSNIPLEAILGIALVVGFAVVLIAPLVIAFLLIRKLRARIEKNRLEARAGLQPEPSMGQNTTVTRQSAATVILLSLLAIFWGMIVGFVAAAISQVLYIVFVIPLLMGFNGGQIVVDVVKRGKIHKLTQMILLSVVWAVVAYGTFQYARYMAFQLTVSMEIFSGLEEATEAQSLQVTSAFVDYALKEETGHAGFLGYMLYEAGEGATIGRLTRSSGVKLGPALTWLYWLVEFGLILGLTIQKGRGALTIAACGSCGKLFDQERHLGGTAAANESLLLEVIGQKNFAGLGSMMEQNADVPSLEVYYQGCDCAHSQAQLVVRHAFLNAQGRLHFQDRTQSVLLPGESALLLNQLSFSGD